MSEMLQLLFPGRSSSQPVAGAARNEKSFSSAMAHFLTSLAVAIIIGIGVALAAHFLAHSAIEWTAIAGGGAALVSGIITYIILRCVFGRNDGKGLREEILQTNDSQNEKPLVGSDHRANSSVKARDKSNKKLTTDSATYASNPTSVVTHSDRVHGSSKKVDVKGTVYIHSTSSGPIRHDRRFEYAKRLRTENSEPMQIKDNDFYLELVGEFETGLFKKKFFFLDKNGLPNTYIYLPSCLFEGIKEGESVRFFYDDTLIELTCRQVTHPYPPGASWTFEGFLDYVKARIQYDHTQALWHEDVEGEPKFMGQLVGRELVQLDSLNNAKTPIQDFQFFDDDQKRHGAYQKIQVIDYDDNTVLFNIHRDHRLDISDIALIESKGFNGLHQIWILIPHKPEKNQFPENAQEVTCHHGNRKQTFYKDSFNPQKGDRMVSYHYGQYSMRTLRDTKQFHLSFDESGWLKLNIES